ncbi:MAG: fluoride efflux transporter CrcB [Bernardetiaceae bacterium]
MAESLLVMLGGGLGSWLRFMVSRYGNPVWEHFPLGTFVANALSCLLLGFFVYLMLHKPIPWVRPLVLVGFCGGFSTFSTFSNENWHLLRNGQWNAFFGYALGSLLTGWLMLWLGGKMAQWMSN